MEKTDGTSTREGNATKEKASGGGEEFSTSFFTCLPTVFQSTRGQNEVGWEVTFFEKQSTSL